MFVFFSFWDWNARGTKIFMIIIMLIIIIIRRRRRRRRRRRFIVSFWLVWIGIRFKYVFLSTDIFEEKSDLFTASLQTQDHVLLSHVIGEFNVQDVQDCVQKCIKTAKCYSINYQYQSTAFHKCELSNSTKGLSQSSFVPAPGFIYYDWHTEASWVIEYIE